MKWKGSKEIGIQYHARHHPRKPAIISDEGALTFRELHLRANRMANALVNLGIKPHDTLAVLLPNSARALEVFTAAGRIGAVPVALNCRFKGEEISYIVNQSEARLLILGGEFLPAILSIRDRMPRVEHLVAVGPTGPKPPPDPLWDLEELMARCSENDPPSGTMDGVSASLIYTSGTTGRPKGCYKTSRRRLETLLFYADLYGFRREDVHLMVCPFYHSAPNAFAIMALVLGNTLVILRRFDPLETLKAIRQHQVTTTFKVPTQINQILHLPHDLLERWRPSSLKVLIVAAAPFPFPLKRKAVEYFGDGRLYEFYGATEQSMNTLLYPHEQLERPGSCGRAIPGNEILLLGKDGNPVAPGEVGELFVKNDYLMDCYYNMPEETAKVFRNGYCSVGDLARVDDDGYYYIVDRKVDMVISGGVNIYPVEIEECLYRHPKVFDAAVIGVEDPMWGERLVAYIVLQPGAEMIEQELQDHVASHLADYKKPKEVYFVDELPYSAQGKLLKRESKALYSRQTETAGMRNQERGTHDRRDR